uniref:Uncharacterized protein n=1 Tax=Phytophthora ramorum TaxID=164328 RepID=H3H3W0_PHYRM
MVSSRDAKIRAKRLAAIREAFDSPYTNTNTPKYKWPTKLLTRPKDGSNRVQMVRLHPESGTRRVRFTRDAATQTEDDPEEDIVLMRSVGVEASDLVDGSSDGIMEAVHCGENDPECTTSEVATDDENLDHGSKSSNNLDASDSLDLPVAVMTGTPMDKLKKEYDRCMRVTVEELDFEPAVYMREGSEILSQLRDQLALLPDLQDLSPECNIEEADVGDPVKSTPEMVDKLRRILKQHRKIFLGDGNAAPAPARGVVCDLDVGDAKPVAQRPRSIAPHLMLKVYELLEKLLETGLIEHSESQWASPIVIVLKKNGIDIRMCIDYRVVNEFIKLLHYPLPLIDDLLIGFESAMWFMSLDMASGFWAVRMTERAKLISAFVCPFGHFQWIRMPFGLKNAPLIYQAVINNCLWGFVRLDSEEEAKVDPDVLDFLKLDPLEPRSPDSTEEDFSVLTDKMTVFQRNIPAPPQMGPVLGRSSYIDDIAHGAPTWDHLLPKSEFGKLSIPYLSHEISAEGIRAKPKIAKGVQDLPFPKTLKGVQSFMGSLNYYNKFIEDLPVIAAVLYELTDEQIRAGRDLSRAKEAFEILKRKIVSTPLLRHPDRTRPFVIIPHANQWAASAVLGQEYDGVNHPVRFTGRVLNDAELRYQLAEKESADGKNVKWGVILSHWNLEIRRVQRDEDGLPAILDAGITPREHLDEVAENLIPAKGRVAPIIPISLEMLGADFEGHILIFDGAAKTSTRRGSCGCILWRLPGWKVLDAQGFVLEDVTVNDAEYSGLLKGLNMVLERDVQEIVVVGDSRIIIQQAQGLINCHQPNLQRKLAEYEALRPRFKSVRLVHVKREFNQAADYLTSKTLLLDESWKVEDEDELTHLQLVSKIHEKLMKPAQILNAGVQDDNGQDADSTNLPGPESAPLPLAAKVLVAVTRVQTQDEPDQGDVMGPIEYQAERWRRIKLHQDKDAFLMQLKHFLKGDVTEMSNQEACQSRR